MFHNIPEELRQYRQFVLWKYEDAGGKKLTKVPYSQYGYPASVTNPNSWCDFETAVRVAAEVEQVAGIGFVLTSNDPFALIDLDDPYDDTKAFSTEKSEEILARQIKIFEMFGSYSERSPSGKGLHILCKGNIPNGRKRGQIEVYSNARFLTLTGDVFRSGEIVDRNDLLNTLWSEMGKDVVVYEGFEGAPETMLDAEVCDRAANAANGTKFVDLWNGHWQSYYSSQSEADFALIDIIAFYTQARNQIYRIFRSSGLGQRDKAFRDDYVDYMINRAFDHMLPPIDVEGLRIQIEAAIMAKNAASCPQVSHATASDMPAETPADSSDTNPASEQAKPRSDKRSYPKPPGLMGEIADFIYAQSIRPVPEIALAGAIGLMSGICGRAYNINGTGLNQYTLLIADTGTGKEAMAQGIDRLMNAVSSLVPNSGTFIGPGDISSSQALSKHFHRHGKSFVAMPGEIGIWLQGICSTNAAPHASGIKRALLTLYNSSGCGRIYKPTINSDKDKSTDATKAPAFSLLGESTPEEFYKALDESMISSGLLPRFSVVEYRGKRPKKNPYAKDAVPSDHLIKSLSTVCVNALALNEQDRVIDVGWTNEAYELMEQFDVYCDNRINAENIESGAVKKQLWNRAHMKALKLAALVAVGNHAYQPVIDYAVAEWAIKIVYDDCMNLIARFDAGEIGADTTESRQITDLVACIREYLISGMNDLNKYHVAPSLHAERIVSYSYLQRRLCNTTAFKNDRAGARNALVRALQTLIDRGDIREVPRSELAQKYNTTQKAFMAVIPRTFGF